MAALGNAFKPTDFRFGSLAAARVDWNAARDADRADAGRSRRRTPTSSAPPRG